MTKSILGLMLCVSSLAEIGIDATELHLSVSKEESDVLYDTVGMLIKVDEHNITMRSHSYLLSDSVHSVIQEVLNEHPIPFKLQDFQLLTLYALGSQKSVVVLVSPTGSGKMIWTYLGSLVLQKIFGIENGIMLGTMPISAQCSNRRKN